MERRRRTVSSEEAKLWRDAMRGVTPLPDRVALAEEDPPEMPPAPQAPSQVASPPPPAVKGPRNTLPPVAPRLEHGRWPGLDKSTGTRLKKGDMVIEARLDLHGLTQETAHAALWRFVTVSAEMGRRCVLVITGKGNRDGAGVLRGEVPRWLNESGLRPLVLGFAYAQPRHGGEGALYVLLKRHR